MKEKHNKFLKLPEYPGGKEAFRKYIKENLNYPDEALKNKIEGVVYLSAEIDDNGKVKSVLVDNGLGYGCDEEAARLIKNIHYGSVKNRGVRLKTKRKFRVEFKLPAQKRVNYSITKSDSNRKETDKKDSGNGNKYSYTIKL